MKNSKLVNILKSLSKEEFKYLGWFVRSDFFNTDKNIISFYEILKKWHPDFTSKNLEKSKVFQSLFPSRSYNDGKMRNLMLKMSGLLEQYLIELEIKTNPLKRELTLIEALRNRNFNENHKKRVLAIIDLINSQKIKNEDDYYIISNLSQALYFHSNIITTSNPHEFLYKAHSNLKKYFQLAKLKLECELMTIKASNPLVYSISSTQSSPENELIEIFSKIPELHETGGNALFQNIKKFFTENIDTLSSFDKRFILKHLLEFSIRNIRINAVQYYREVFELYKIGDECSILSNNGNISYTTFLNVVTNAARIKEFSWVIEFIENNKAMLPIENRHEISSLGMAYVLFYQKKYWETINIVSELYFKNTLYQLLSKSISLQSYFELFVKDNSYYDLTYSYTKSFEKYIDRNPKIGKNKTESYLSYIRLTRNIIDSIYGNERNESNKKKFFNQLNAIKSIVERKWLGEQILKHL